MTDPEAIQLALTDYRIIFVGNCWEDISAAWQTEYTNVRAGAFTPTIITSANYQGGGATGIKNFEQAIRLRALQLMRLALDHEFREHGEMAAAPTVMYPVFGPNAFAH